MWSSILRRGLGTTLHHWRALLPLFGTTLALSLLGIWPVYRYLGSGALHTTLVRRLATDLGGAPLGEVLTNAPDAAAVFGLWTFSTLGLLLLTGLAYNLFSGGILSRYSDTAGFWPGCRRFVGTFTALGIIGVSLLVVLSGLLIMLIGGLGGSLAIRLAVVFVVAQLLNMLLEYSRAVAVVRGERNPLRAMTAAGRFCAAHLPGTLGLAALGLALWAALFGVYNLVAPLLSPVGLVVLLIIWQQLIVLGQQLIKMLRLSWAVAYLQPQAE